MTPDERCHRRRLDAPGHDPPRHRPFPRDRARIERAATLFALGHVELIGETSAWVVSQTGDGRRYLVTPGMCNCIDSQRHPGQSCKHRWVVDIVLVAEERQRRLDARAAEQRRRAIVSADAVALAYTRSIRWAA